MNKLKMILSGLVLLTITLKAQEVKTIEVKPVGIYAEIDVAGQNRMIKQLYDPNTRNATVDTIFNNITHYNPPVIYLFSQALYMNGEKEPAVQWYLYAQLNALYDAARCADNTAKQAVEILEERYRPTLDEYMKQNKPMVTETAGKVLQLYKSLQSDYDIRWINLHGMGAFAGAFGDELPKEAPKLTVDKLLWPGIEENILKEFAERWGVKEK
ncbi:MAG: hypothetical protein Q8904_04130 [Bacteroidota bacterium]|nr:hypothetical protein [Bacteroidota bacterium]